MQILTTRPLINKAMRAYLAGQRPFGGREARTWFIENHDGELLPLKYIIGMSSGVPPKDFNTSDAITTAKGLSFNSVFIGAELLEDLAKVQRNPTLDETNMERLILARIGQGRFRKDLIAEHAKCFVTGYADPRLLVASHIKPWAHSSNTERLDPKNGLLLIPQLDQAFDRGLITFREDGRVLLSRSLKNAQILGIEKNMKLVGVATRQTYLDHHRRKVFVA